MKTHSQSIFDASWQSTLHQQISQTLSTLGHPLAVCAYALFSAVLLLLPISIGAAGLVRIELPTAVGVARSDVRLGEVASMATLDLKLLERLMALPLGPAPAVGQIVQVGRAQLIRWIQVRTGLRREQVEWSGANVTELRRSSGEIASAQITTVAGDTLRSWLAGRSTRAEVTETAMSRDITVPLGKTILRARPISLDLPLTKRMVVWVDVWVEDRFVRTVPVGFDIVAYGSAYISSLDVPQGASIELSQLGVREVELTDRVVPLLPVAHKLSGAVDTDHVLRLRRALPAGKPLTRIDVESPLAVARGDWVALSVHFGSIDLESSVEALQDGRVGQMVNVKPAKAEGTISARVIGPGRVEIRQ
jgi:flagellar basal body P-ring formation protein FlgA